MRKPINGSMQHVSRSGEKGRTASLWLVGESRILYVGIRKSKRMLHMAFFIKTFLIRPPTAYL